MGGAVLSQQQALDAEVSSAGSCLWEDFLSAASPTYTGSNSFNLFGNELGFYSWIPRIMVAVSEHTPA